MGQGDGSVVSGKNGWGDVLAGITTGNVTTNIATDSLGNITNDGTWEYSWKNGGQLASMENDIEKWDFFYDASGMRTQRTDGSVTYTYTYDGTQLIQMTYGSYVLIFTYGINGHPMSVKYENEEYYYITNALGDVIGILDSNGNEVVTYIYDAWGNCILDDDSEEFDLGYLNPLRYRGYVYDEETKLYYLQSRYYNPDICRFISADSISYLGADGTPVSYNLFAYRGNSPVLHNHTVKSDINSNSYSVEASFNNSSNYETIENLIAFISKTADLVDNGISVTPALRTLIQYSSYPALKDLNRLYGLDFVPGKLNVAAKKLAPIFLFGDVVLSAIGNITNNSLTTEQKLISFGVDTTYTFALFGISEGVGLLVSFIPVVGVVMAPIASVSTALIIDTVNGIYGGTDYVKSWLYAS